jgi:ferrous iron transport protein B
MAARTIESSKARLLTILIAPLMSCSARLPIYGLMIDAFVPDSRFLWISLRVWTLLGMYSLGTVAAFCMAWLFNKTLLKGDSPTFLLEMPPYRKPDLRSVIVRMGEQAWQFVYRAGTVILAIQIVLWFLETHPKITPTPPPANITQQSEQLERSYAGQLGRLIEPTIRPLGFDWKMGIGLISSFAAREVFVATMATIYTVSDADEEKTSKSLGQRLKLEKTPDGKPVYTPLVAVCLMVFFVLAMQCMSTIAVVKRETNGWKWPLFQLFYMTTLAWVVTFLVRWIGIWIFNG